MTTVNTIEDLVRILDERPEWNEALRARVLSRELLNLPQTLADFAESTERRLTALEATQAEMQATLADMQAAGLASLTDINQLIISATPVGAVTLYVDNVYFY